MSQHNTSDDQIAPELARAFQELVLWMGPNAPSPDTLNRGMTRSIAPRLAGGHPPTSQGTVGPTASLLGPPPVAGRRQVASTSGDGALRRRAAAERHWLYVKELANLQEPKTVSSSAVTGGARPPAGVANPITPVPSMTTASMGGAATRCTPAAPATSGPLGTAAGPPGADTGYFICENCQEINVTRVRDYFYVVTHGLDVGVFTNLHEAHANTNGVSGNSYRRYSSLELAEAAWDHALRNGFWSVLSRRSHYRRHRRSSSRRSLSPDWYSAEEDGPCHKGKDRAR